MKILIPFCLLSFVLSSCLIKLVNDNYYKELHPDDKKYIYKLTSFDNLENRRIYEINGLQLKEELAKYDSALVYIFMPSCKGSTCYPLAIYEDYAQRKNYKLFFLPYTYFGLHEIMVQNFNSPLFAVDVDYYGLKKTKDYMKAFRKDLGNMQNSGSKLIFHKGDFIRTMNVLE